MVSAIDERNGIDPTLQNRPLPVDGDAADEDPAGLTPSPREFDLAGVGGIAVDEDRVAGRQEIGDLLKRGECARRADKEDPRVRIRVEENGQQGGKRTHSRHHRHNSLFHPVFFRASTFQIGRARWRAKAGRRRRLHFKVRQLKPFRETADSGCTRPPCSPPATPGHGRPDGTVPLRIPPDDRTPTLTRALEHDSRARSRAFAATGDGRAAPVE